MGRSGADPLPRDLARLTPREREVYEWACAEHAAGRVPTCTRIASHFRFNQTWASDLIRRIRAKYRWPCPPYNRPSGSYGLTQPQRNVLAMAIELWEHGEYPSVRRLSLLMGYRSTGSRSVRLCIKKCVCLGIWPCKRKKVRKALSAEERDFLLSFADRVEDIGRSPRHRAAMQEEMRRKFRERFGRTLGILRPYLVLKKAGRIRAVHRRPPVPLEVRKAAVIADRNGIAPRKLEDPAAYRRTIRRPHPES